MQNFKRLISNYLKQFSIFHSAKKNILLRGTGVLPVVG
jgi:hypothetical protein